jgi:hypothetical protein
MEQVVEKEQALYGPTVAGASLNALILGDLYSDAGKYMEAAARIEKVFALREMINGPEAAETLWAKSWCAATYQRAGRFHEAGFLLRDLLARDRKRTDPMGQVTVARTLTYLSKNLLLQNRPAEAEPLAREARALYERNRTRDREWMTSYLTNLLGGSLLEQKKYADAEPLLQKGYEGMKKQLAKETAQQHYRFIEAGERVVRYYEETNQPEKAREWREKILEDGNKK